jgi:hypothetical protein
MIMTSRERRTKHRLTDFFSILADSSTPSITSPPVAATATAATAPAAPATAAAEATAAVFPIAVTVFNCYYSRLRFLLTCIPIL